MSSSSDFLLTVCRYVYVVDAGGMFEYVSCANYLGEIAEWWGFAVASWSLPAAAFALMTMCNLAPRALHHHRSVRASSVKKVVGGQEVAIFRSVFQFCL